MTKGVISSDQALRRREVGQEGREAGKHWREGVRLPIYVSIIRLSVAKIIVRVISAVARIRRFT
jgi:hypothetical protein